MPALFTVEPTKSPSELLAAQKAAERQRLWDATPEAEDEEAEVAAGVQSTAAPAPAEAAAPSLFDASAPAAAPPSFDVPLPVTTANGPLGQPRVVKLIKAPDVDIGAGLKRGKGSDHVIVDFVKKDSPLRGHVRRGEAIFRVNGTPVSCKREADVRALVKELKALGGPVSLRVKPAALKKKRAGCCGAARPGDDSDPDDAECRL